MDRGAHYVKADLQAHSPRDRNWAGEYVTDEERRQFARDFVAACRKTGLQAVAITDHDDFLFAPYIRRAAREEVDEDGDQVDAAKRIVVFPGLELSLEVPCQALLIFSADFPDERLSAVLEKLDIDAAAPSERWGAHPQKRPFRTLQELHERLDQTDWLRGQYIVLPNVTDGGYKTLMRSGMDAAYRDMPCVGGYLDKPATTIGVGNHRIFAGKDPARGNKPLATLQTSDARSFEALGSNASWIKWVEPTAEALRQACLAARSRIAHTEPPLPSVHITRLVVSNSKFLGPVSLALNPQYNALIGGRGTGKSSVLEYLRWGLCDQPPGLDEGTGGPDLAARRRRLIDRTLIPVEGHVEVHFELNGIKHVVRRYANSSELRLKIGDHPMAQATETEVRSLLPIRAYSQRQLSDVGVDLAELRRFVTGPIEEPLAANALARTELEARIRRNFAQLEQLRSLSEAVARDTLALDSLAQQTAAIRADLGGLSDEDRATIEKKPVYDDASAVMEDLRSRLDRATAALEDAASTVDSLANGSPSHSADTPPEAHILRVAQDAADAALAAASATLVVGIEAIGLATGPVSSMAAAEEQWATAYAAFNDAYDDAAKRSTTHQSRLEELGDLEARRKALQKQVDERAQERRLLGDPETAHEALRSEWREVHRQRTKLLEAQCGRFEQLSDGLIRAGIKPGAGFTLQLQRFKTALQGSGVRSAKIESFLLSVSSAAKPLTDWHAALDELEQLVRTGHDSRTPTRSTSALEAFTPADLARMASVLTTQTILELSLVAPEDDPVFEYRPKEGEHIAFGEASAGQQATALLRVLLHQPGPPLIIDQPEDDLDSEVIQEIVDLIWNAKERRQLIFSSHNANLIVNGDAELVACFGYRTAGDHSAGQIEGEGAIDVPRIRSRITAVMEGGEKAFRLRADKYGF